MSECKCDLRTKLVGDGCSVCNPAKSLEYAQDTIEDQAEEITGLENRLAEALALAAHWKANHDNQVNAGRLLKERLDMPVERVKAYETMVELNLRLQATLPVPGYTLVKTQTLNWLLGEGDDFECDPKNYFRGKPTPYFWRKQLREDMLPGSPVFLIPSVESVEEEVGMGSLGWETIDPEELIFSIIKLASENSK